MTTLYCPRAEDADYHAVKRAFQPQGDEWICDEHGCRMSTFKPRKSTLSRSPSSQPKRGRKKGMKRSELKREWGDAKEKCWVEGRCRVCGTEAGIEAAHIMGRKHDEPISEGSRTLYVHPDRIVPLCGTEYGTRDSCHARHDAHELDLLQHLSLDEQLRAVADAGSIESARVRLAPSAYKEFANG